MEDVRVDVSDNTVSEQVESVELAVTEPAVEDTLSVVDTDPNGEGDNTPQSAEEPAYNVKDGHDKMIALLEAIVKRMPELTKVSIDEDVEEIDDIDKDEEELDFTL